MSFVAKEQRRIKKEAEELANLLPKEFSPKVVETKSYSGGGAMPSHYLESFGVAIGAKQLACFDLDEARLERYLRSQGIIARLENSALVLDLRTLLDGDKMRIIEAFIALMNKIKDN